MAGNSRDCIDCKAAPSCVTVRTRALCEFLQTKVLRRMDRYRPSGLLEKQSSAGPKRTAFDLHVLVVDTASSVAPKSVVESGRLDKIKETYPGHTYTEMPLHRILEYDASIKGLLSHYSAIPSDNITRSDEEALALFHASFSTATARADIKGILLRRLVVAFATSHECDGILWGDSDSRLAAKTLANVAKGRGSTLVWDACDGMSPWGIYFNFPLRDLYKTELELFASYAMRTIEPVIERDPQNFGDMSTRHMSIEDLMSQYVMTQGAKYPGVMANIVRTVDKLQTPAATDGTLCILCGMPADLAADGEPTMPSAEGKTGKVQPTCYGCRRTLLDMKAPALWSG
ncbi:predicted protein [Uncinocarpus reesii 1704]|uniref:Cytoplasmic tRNA 2-thiolation protein 2 n=1 Tax=Uncinocarpus reesii (strain UAMH 1704) TaxID=336963 RepID=C4JV19_UNCRE|nr:uncharacterized protein UREG_04972 [Uncinocarpus reesii 1704]EEP80130.1 predicted protein [Uncinocarpus reesii 1704]